MKNNLQKQFIDTYRRNGADSPQYQALKAQLYQQGATWLEVVELHIAADLYSNTDKFSRK